MPRVPSSRPEQLRLLLAADPELSEESDTRPINALRGEAKSTLAVALGSSGPFRLSLE